MKVRFKETVTIYPDGVNPLTVQEGSTHDLTAAYAQLMITKGHAETADDQAVAEAAPAPATGRERVK